VIASTERKAIETAEALADARDIAAFEEFREVRKPWFDEADDHRAAAARYLAGEALADWEPLAEAAGRFQAGIDAHRGVEDLVIATHGIVMSAWLTTVADVPDPFRFWSELRMPDTWEVDLARGRYRRVTAAT
jgi:broad specificity phosphatase PhoE